MIESIKTIYTDIRAAIAAKLAEIEKIQDSNAYEKPTFSGYPAAVIRHSDDQSTYGSTANDKIVLTFEIRLYYIIESEDQYGEAEAALDEVAGEVLAMFMDRTVLGSACDWVEPVPTNSEWESRGEATFNVRRIFIRCIKYTG